jgi:hypothetical protein
LRQGIHAKAGSQLKTPKGSSKPQKNKYFDR